MGWEEGDNRGKIGKGLQGTCIKDPWTKPNQGRIDSGRRCWVEQGKVVVENGDNCT